MVIATEFFDGVVPVFLERMDLLGEPTEHGDRAGALVGIGDKLLLRFRPEEELRKMSGGELQTDLGELAGVVLAQVFSEIILEQAGFDSAIVFETPLFISATSFPIGNVAKGDGEAVFIQCSDDFVMGHVFAKHPVDHVALVVREAGDFAVAGFGLEGARKTGRLDGWLWRLGWWSDGVVE